jgi:hypothetical protein
MLEAIAAGGNGFFSVRRLNFAAISVKAII